MKSLKEKYGDKRVMVVPASMVEEAVKRDIKNNVSVNANMITDNGKELTLVPFRSYVNSHMTPMLRYMAEEDNRYRQVIGYVVVTAPDGSVLCSERLAGDERLVGQVSFGMGGHIDYVEPIDGVEQTQETVIGSIYRELEEEMGITQKDIMTLKHLCYICSNKTAVDKVHVAIVYKAILKEKKFNEREPDKHSSFFASPEEIYQLQQEKRLESWSDFLVDTIIKGSVYSK